MLKKDKILQCRLSVTTGSFLYFNVISVYNTIKKGSFLAPFFASELHFSKVLFQKTYNEGTIYIKQGTGICISSSFFRICLICMWKITFSDPRKKANRTDIYRETKCDLMTKISKNLPWFPSKRKSHIGYAGTYVKMTQVETFFVVS